MAQALYYHHPIIHRQFKAVQADCFEILYSPELDSNFVKNDILIFSYNSFNSKGGLYKSINPYKQTTIGHPHSSPFLYSPVTPHRYLPTSHN